MLRWMLALSILLTGAWPAEAALLRVTLVPELSDANVWRFEVINDSVDTLDVVRLVATFSTGEGRRLWAQPVFLTPTLLQPGDSGWATIDARTVPAQALLEIDWDLTWNPYRVPVVPNAWRTERVASIEVRRATQAAPAAAPPAEQAPPAPPAGPTYRPWDGDRWLF